LVEFIKSIAHSIGAPSGKTVGLHDKVSHMDHRFGLSPSAVQQMMYLVTGELTAITFSYL